MIRVPIADDIVKIDIAFSVRGRRSVNSDPYDVLPLWLAHVVYTVSLG